MKVVTISSKGNLLESLRAEGCYVPAVCGGKGSCGKCAVRLVSGSLPISDADRACFSQLELDGGWRLACTAFPNEAVSVEIPGTGDQQFSIVSDFCNDITCCSTDSLEFHGDKEDLRTKNANSDSRYGIAVDIGTTTICMALVDITRQKAIANYVAVNRQREFGGDVISRIQSANNGNLLRLSESVRGQIQDGVAGLAAQTGIKAGCIEKMVIAGNTTMIHLLLCLDCHALGQAPFSPVMLELRKLPCREIFTGELSCDMVILPGISAYVGADICAGLFFTMMHAEQAPAILLDIGTNGEMVLAHNGKILCAATAAGPAFEGGNIRWGTGSVPGAIDHVQCTDGAFSVTTIDGKPPVGICGSGVIETAYQGLANGLILASGRLTGGALSLAKAPDGRDIAFCQKDVRELQLAKSAIRSGLDALLHHAGLGYGDIQTLYIAGGFGFHLNLECAAGIGLLPAPLLPKVSVLGNSALGGAVQYLLNSALAGAGGCDAALAEIVAQAREFNLGDDGYFKSHFIQNLDFDNF